MPIIKSAKKRVRTARRATVRNVKTKRNLKTALKSFQTSLTGKSASQRAAETHAHAQSALDKAGKSGVMHKNKVARKKRQLAAQAKAAGVKVAGSGKKTVAKPTAKRSPAATKSTTVKAAAKKPAAKKPAAKKPAAKKTTKK